ncbi:hypothetical protein Agub_g7899 [Astrephomene gubernaculifera]|uniref:Uncharacterized protein n=1 Tax=Astrephomene gubernaculifera TaxID=47775 RepID=A0AAD3DQS4_9CHLO|nr:hypothetical protein Agub_g7899 [Astrephomene gubernaculifera]
MAPLHPDEEAWQSFPLAKPDSQVATKSSPKTLPLYVLLRMEQCSLHGDDRDARPAPPQYHLLPPGVPPPSPEPPSHPSIPTPAQPVTFSFTFRLYHRQH